MQVYKENFAVTTVEPFGVSDVLGGMSGLCSYSCSSLCCLILLAVLVKVLMKIVNKD